MLAAFDLDGTLVDQVSAARTWTQEFVTAWALPDAAIDQIAALLSERRPKGPLFGEIVQEWSLPTSGDQVAAAYRLRMPQLVTCTPEDQDALAQLRSAGWTIGIVTNGTVVNQEGKIRATGLAKLVDGWVISEEVGYRKPDPELFRVLARNLGCALDGWMIGDSLEHDIAGGSAVGLQTIWITSKAPNPTDAPGPTRWARNVADAVKQIIST